MEHHYVFDRDELEKFPYKFLCETRESNVWNTFKRRLLWYNVFTNTERQEAEKIFNQCHRWYLVSGLPDKVSMSATTLGLWMKLESFCASIQ